MDKVHEIKNLISYPGYLPYTHGKSVCVFLAQAHMLSVLHLIISNVETTLNFLKQSSEQRVFSSTQCLNSPDTV